jgi:hypothetical protein
VHDGVIFYASLMAVSLSLIVYLYLARRSISGLDRAAFAYQSGYMAFFFALTPFLHVLLDVYIDVSVEDWVMAMARLNVVNGVGLVFSIVGFLVVKKAKWTDGVGQEAINVSAIRFWSLVFFSIGFLVFLYIFQSYGASILISDERSSPSVLPIYVYMLVESLPMLLGWAYVASLRMRERRSSFYFWLGLGIVSLLALFMSGTRGSRIAMLLQVSSYIVVYSLLVSRIGAYRFISIFIVAFLSNQFYSVYKHGGLDAFIDYYSYGERSGYIERSSESTFVVLHDFGRADVQALVYDRVIGGQYEPPFFPHSYISGIQIVLPKIMRFDGVYSKVEMGAVLQYGGVLGGSAHSTRIYGFIPEFAMNFGLISLPFVFFLFGAIHASSLRACHVIRKKWLVFLYPYFSFLPVFILFYDFDNIVFVSIKTWAVPFVVVLLGRFVPISSFRLPGKMW